MKMMVSALMSIALSLAVIAPASAAGFTDISWHWAEDIITEWKGEGIIRMYSGCLNIHGWRRD